MPFLSIAAEATRENHQRKPKETLSETEKCEKNCKALAQPCILILQRKETA